MLCCVGSNNKSDNTDGVLFFSNSSLLMSSIIISIYEDGCKVHLSIPEVICATRVDKGVFGNRTSSVVVLVTHTRTHLLLLLLLMVVVVVIIWRGSLVDVMVLVWS